MAINSKVLGQAGPANTNLTTLYSVGTGKSAVVSTLSITNVSSSAAKPKVHVRVNGASAVDANLLVPDLEVLAKSMITLTLGVTLAAGDVISVQTDTSSALTFMAFGQEIS
jgi:hypothetical protein